MMPVTADGKVLYLPLLQSSTKSLQLIRSRSVTSPPVQESSRNPVLLRSASDAGTVSDFLHSPLVQPSRVFSQSPLVQSLASPLPLVQSPLAHSTLVQSPLAQSPLAQSSLAQSTLAHTPLAHSPLAQAGASPVQSPVVMFPHSPLGSPLVSPLGSLVRAPLPVSPLAKGVQSVAGPRAQATRILFKEEDAENIVSRDSNTGPTASSNQSKLSSGLSSLPKIKLSQGQTQVKVTSQGQGYKAADEATKQHLAKLLNTDQASLGQVQVMELGADSIQQMGLAGNVNDDSEVLYVIQMNDEVAILFLLTDIYFSI